jgi:tetratricopeptide (TPR) repeat protein
MSLTACMSLSRRQPNFLWPQLLRAIAQTELGKFPAAEADFQGVLAQATDPSLRAAALTNRGFSRIQQKRWEDAIRDLREAIELQHDSSEAHVSLALAYQGAGNLDKAIATLTEAIGQRKDALLCYTRAQLHRARGDLDSAWEDFSECIKLEPKGARSERLASAYVERGHLYHLNGKVHLTRGDWASAEEAFAGALDECAEALRAFPDYPAAYRQQAETLLALGLNAEAGKALDRFLVLAPERERTAKVYRTRGLVHVQLGEYAEAVNSFDRALERQPDADTLRDRGWAYLKAGALQPALADFDKALGLNARDCDALCGRGLVLVLLDRVPEAAAAAGEAVEAGPRTADLLFRAACIHARAVGRVEARLHGRELSRRQERDLRDQLDVSRTQFVALLRTALDPMPREGRRAFWRDKVEREGVLAPVRRELTELAGRYGL